ncbi:MAG: hypothetical protein ABL901_00360 [Hyphomicrobiaceae bacterium]
MFIIRIFVNLLILALELAVILGVAALGYTQPLIFAAVTFVLALWLGARLEFARLKNELNFYFEHTVPTAGFFTGVVALTEAASKAILAGLVALLTFSGTDAKLLTLAGSGPNRLQWTAIAFAGCLFAGSSLLRWLWNAFEVSPGRWGYFRIAAPLGLLFSAALSFLPPPTFSKIGWDLVFNLAARPSLEQASEMLFMLKQKFDSLFYALLQGWLGDHLAAVVGVLVSVNMLTGFILGIYAVVIAEMVRWLEARGS